MADNTDYDNTGTITDPATGDTEEPATRHDVTEGGVLGAVGGAIVGAIAAGPLAPVGAIVGAVVGGIASAAAVDVVDKHDHDYSRTVSATDTTPIGTTSTGGALSSADVAGTGVVSTGYADPAYTDPNFTAAAPGVITADTNATLHGTTADADFDPNATLRGTEYDGTAHQGGESSAATRPLGDDVVVPVTAPHDRLDDEELSDRPVPTYDRDLNSER